MTHGSHASALMSHARDLDHHASASSGPRLGFRVPAAVRVNAAAEQINLAENPSDSISIYLRGSPALHVLLFSDRTTK